MELCLGTQLYEQLEQNLSDLGPEGHAVPLSGHYAYFNVHIPAYDPIMTVGTVYQKLPWEALVLF